MTYWYVGFCPILGRPQLVQRLLREGYAHCWAARRIDQNLWYWVEWTPERLILGLCDDALVLRASGGATEVLAITLAEDAPAPRRPQLALHHCATIVSHVVGLRAKPWATPWALRCALLRAGAFAVVPSSQEQTAHEVPESPDPQPSGA